MYVALLLGLQSVAGPPAPRPERLRPARECEPGEGEPGDIVVCGRRDDDQYRLKPLPERYDDPTLPRAEMALGPGKLSAETEAASVGGVQSNRVMLRFKVPF
ncbi:hypothetical protein [Sphingomonas lenta]|uniref:Uncharacterized protein n=1 Tax=Sphingomonas lenta TaxID=1141887 RepID=A0A2A2SGV1_9SPHN|nr:hypothetical protein [Sphingomonas lenta]PAX08445.1 hypothetical protein CKY28_03370 [Sphingomonas lenta]